MRRPKGRNPRIAGLLAFVLGAMALLALSGIAVAKDHGDHRGDDHGHHGRHHHRFIDEAGTIASFDSTTGKLTVALQDGSAAAGLVTADTRIECEGVDQRPDRRDHGGESGSGGGGDHSGQFEPGDDNGDDGVPTPTPAEGECSTASLVVGAVVGDAELRLGTGTAVFTEIELGHDS